MALFDYDEPVQESVLGMAPSGDPLVLVSDRAHVSAKLKNGFDRQTKAGKNFGRVKFLGIEPAKFTVTFEVLAGPEEQNFNDSVTALFRRRGRRGNSPPFDVVNLQINRLGIDTVTVVEADIGPPDARTGRIVTVQLEEWTRSPVDPNADKKAGSKTNNEPLTLSSGLASTVEAANQG